MTARTLTEIRDVDDDGDTVTQIVIGPSHKYCAELMFNQWSVGEYDPGSEKRVHLEIDDARALRDALTAAIDAAPEEPKP